ncbi:hypothetical protein [Fredinandcohnia quinoae]|uniref:SipL SPOCS domain-containing protein n=1 Tax=Fredinandcohnia quinoae TaxID=2918902 RepID=A0AAW5EAS4_9BACI|nr:hypothetical protein [Fredinandcohnia sp. SECRCQ15]
MSQKYKEKVCIKTRKVFDWVTRQVEIPIINMADDKLDTNFKCRNHKDKDFKDVDKLCKFLLEEGNDFSVSCFLSNEKGERIDPRDEEEMAFMCKEIVPGSGRQDVNVTLPNGDTVVLQRVKALVKGFVAVEIESANGDVICTTKGIPFATVQNFLLCAPEGTTLDCHVSFFECDANLICAEDFQQLDVALTLCLEVQIEADVKLEIEAKFCHPRDEILEPTTICPPNKFPQQCPEVFPAY